MTNKERFQEFSQKHEKELPFSLQFDWWNEIVKTHWDVAVVNSGAETVAVWPYYTRSKGPWKVITNPHLTPYCGPFLIYPENQKTSSRISFENKTYETLISQLPPVAEINLHFQVSFSNSLAFIWKGFSDTKKYTYLLDLSTKEDKLYGGLRENTRRQIKKAEKSITITSGEDHCLIKELLLETFSKQKDNYPNIEDGTFSNLVQYIEKYKRGFYWKAMEENVCHSIIICVWDEHTAYYLIGASSQLHKNSGAMSLLMWKAILEAKSKGKKYFNFEGSMNPAIEKFLRGFGGELTAFSRISKESSNLLKLTKNIKP